MTAIGRSALVGIAGAVVMALALASPAAAAALIMATDFNRNDCAGFFGRSFEACQIYEDPDGNQTTEISPVIAVFDDDLAVAEINGAASGYDLFNAVSGREWSFVPDNASKSMGTWFYQPDDALSAGESFDPDRHDPAIRYWATKAGSDFNLFREVAATATATATAIGTGGPCAGPEAFTIGCLNEAIAVSGGTWRTPQNPQGRPMGSRI